MAIFPVTLIAASRQNVSTSAKTQIAVLVTTGSLRRFRLVGFELGAADVPNATDCNIEYGVSRASADGTGTAFTTPFIEALETGTQLAPVETMKIGYTAEPTYTTSVGAQAVVNNSMNQRSSKSWAPLEPAAEPTAPAIAANGFGLWCLSPNYASKMAATLNFRA